MIPSTDAALRTLMMTLMAEIAPQLPAGYAQSNLGMIAVLQMFLAEEHDRAAEVRVWENGEMRRLFVAGAGIVAGLAPRLQQAAAAPDPGLRIQALDAANTKLLALLIELQSELEQLAGEGARELEKQIWDFLVASSERRGFSL